MSEDQKNKWKQIGGVCKIILELIIAIVVVWNAYNVSQINSRDQRRGQNIELTNVIFTHLDKFYSEKQKDLALRMVDSINAEYAGMMRDFLAQEDESPDTNVKNAFYFVWVGGNAQRFNSMSEAEEFLKAVKNLDSNVCIRQFNSGHYAVVKGLLNQAEAQQEAINFGNAGYPSYLSMMSRFKYPKTCK
jgi:hypothetical protein